MVSISRILLSKSGESRNLKKARSGWIDSLRVHVKGGHGGTGLPPVDGVGGHGGNIYIKWVHLFIIVLNDYIDQSK